MQKIIWVLVQSLPHNISMQVPKQKLILRDAKTIKAIKKPIAYKILNCFYENPLTAPQIADAIKFPKDKIHYHIKKLISLNGQMISLH